MTYLSADCQRKGESMHWTASGSVVVMALSLATAAAQQNWPQFRGPDRAGSPRAKGCRIAGQPRRTSNGRPTFLAAAGRRQSCGATVVFLTTVVNTGTSEEPKKGLYFGGNRPTPPESVHQWKVFCLNAATGQVLWERQLHEGVPQTPIHLKNSYASETPTTDGQRVYCYFGNIGVFCLDFSGNVVWKQKSNRDQPASAGEPQLPPCCMTAACTSSTTTTKNPTCRRSTARTGKEIWRVPRDEKSNWSTPYIWQNDLRTEIVTPGSGKVRSYDLNGQLLWWLEGMSGITIATPYSDGGLLYISSGYVGDSLRPIYAIRPGAQGDISLQDGETSNPFIAWSEKRGAPYNPSTLVDEGRLYVLLDRGLLTCYNASDGKLIYGPERLPDGGAFTASPWAYGGKSLLPERGRRDVCCQGRRQVRVAAHQPARRRRHGYGQSRHRRRPTLITAASRYSTAGHERKNLRPSMTARE